MYLVKMKLVTMADGEASSMAETIQVVYQVNRKARLESFSLDLDADPPVQVASFDLAEPGAVNAYWDGLQSLVKRWCDQHGGLFKGAKEEGSGSSQEDDRRPRRIVPVPANAPFPELFRRKNWKSSPWLTPHQRAALKQFHSDIFLHQAARMDTELTFYSICCVFHRAIPQ